ncbi:ATP-binding cassette domain-containing protein [Isoptericola halotolerans]|uniref:Peptide/nickel transport system ATP-binding protein n=1 Tax=Isoptericola halotolerans TaxID=300560 RepID=A0ABX2A7U9_9MICO|nr:ATP-binding cassette domain-containing protein [Isoptericola halotolerans]NOV98681.1 peptide/nickel transport system ATP-binding protein [Isoptericola halotolerans]
MTRDQDALATVDRLTVSAGGRRILDGASLRIADGEVVGLVGASGAGKTTLASTLLGHLRPGLRRDAGTVRVAGLDPFSPADRRTLRTDVVAYLGQDPAVELNPAWSIGAQLRERAHRCGRRLTRADVDDALQRLGLPDGSAGRLPHQLSGGQVRRAAFALAVVHRPRLLVLDEPTSGLDTASAELLAGLVAERAADCSVLLITHDRSALARSADRVLHVEAGAVRETAVATPEESVRRTDGDHSREVLVARGLRAGHRGRPALAPVDLRLTAGTTAAVVGPSGAGKSTLARVLVGLHRRDGGTLELHGRPLPATLGARSGDQRRAVQLVPQDATGSLNPAETVRRTLRRALAAGGRARTADELADEPAGLLAAVRLHHDMLPRRAGELSGGERQRVAVARALACRPAVLICDEITSALDAATATSVLEAVDALRADGTAVVLITHDRDEVARWAHRTTEIDVPG